MYDKSMQHIEHVAKKIMHVRKRYRRGFLSYYEMAEYCSENGTDVDVIVYFLMTPLGLSSEEVEAVTLTIPNKWGSDNEWENPTYKDAIFRLKDHLDQVIPEKREIVEKRLKDWCGVE